MTNTRSSVAVGFAYFAAIMMMVVGVVDILQGISAIVKDHYYVVGAQYLYKVDVTAWGWIHLILGIVLGVAGFFLLNGALWARIVGIITASLVIIANFMWLPYYPVWAIIVIAASVLVIWALTMHGREIAG
ncbi:MAG TPA: hypothetical protein VH496_03080 [Mycobacterium sp.]|jgi:hypothetical protein